MRANLARREPEMLLAWEKAGLPARQEEMAGSGARFVLHDGPPYANGHIHIGTAYNKILKDLVVRSRRLAGRPAPFRPGWDCHGMPIEHKVVETAAGKGRTLERDPLRRAAAAWAGRHLDIQRAQFRRLGVCGRWDAPYRTMDPAFEAREVRLFGQLAVEGYIYRGKRPIHWCLDCRTALAEAEIEHRERESDSIFVLFPLEGDLPGAGGRPVGFLVWTTTPWTLPANQALAVSPAADYCLAATGSGPAVIVAVEALPRLRQEIGLGPRLPGPVVKGRELVGRRARHPFQERAVPVLEADFVVLGEGSGVVHCAPGHGQDDYQLGRAHRLPVEAPVDERGCFTGAVPAWSGTRVWEANPLIIGHLRDRGRLLHHGRHAHSYPHCWRCHEAVIFRATDQWFLNLDHRRLRERLLESAHGLVFHPPESRARFLGMLENRPDWCLSRQRAWGVPVPVLFCRACARPLVSAPVFEHIAALFAREGSDAWFRRPADQLCPPATACACGAAEFRPSTDILDVWFDSGSSWAGVLEADGLYPADLYLEGSDQHRGWFQASLITAVAATGTAPFRALLTHGFIVDDAGRKMSKSRGNVVSPEEVLEQYGADVLRLWAAGQDYRADIQASPDLLAQVAGRYRDLRNTLRFMLGNLDGFDPRTGLVPAGELWPVDRWMLAETAALLGRVDRAFEDLAFHRAVRLLYDFCNQPLSSFYLDIIKDRLYTRAAADPGRRSARSTLYLVLRALLGRLAPVLCFTAEEAWGHLPRRAGDPESVHLARRGDLDDYPPEDPALAAFRWESFEPLRRRVTAAIEDLRAAGRVGPGLEARLEISAAGPEYDFLARFGDALAELFVVSEAFLRPAVAGEPSLSVRAVPTRLPRCPRCWVHSGELGRAAAFPEVCPKCARALADRAAAGPPDA